MRLVVPFVLSLFMLWSVAAAQTEVTGRVDGSVDGAPQTWYTLAFGNGMRSASWSEIMEGLYSFSIHAHPETHYSSLGSVVIDFSFFSRPTACPCIAEYPTMIYYPTDRAQGAVFESGEPEITLSEIEWFADDTVRLVGSFRATLPFRPDFRSEPDFFDTVSLAGTFDVVLAASDFEDD
jgi:hypothetical protein